MTGNNKKEVLHTLEQVMIYDALWIYAGKHAASEKHRDDLIELAELILRAERVIISNS